MQNLSLISMTRVLLSEDIGLAFHLNTNITYTSPNVVKNNNKNLQLKLGWILGIYYSRI